MTDVYSPVLGKKRGRITDEAPFLSSALTQGASLKKTRYETNEGGIQHHHHQQQQQQQYHQHPFNHMNSFNNYNSNSNNNNNNNVSRKRLRGNDDTDICNVNNNNNNNNANNNDNNNLTQTSSSMVNGVTYFSPIQLQKIEEMKKISNNTHNQIIQSKDHEITELKNRNQVLTKGCNILNSKKEEQEQELKNLRNNLAAALQHIHKLSKENHDLKGYIHQQGTSGGSSNYYPPSPPPDVF